MPSKRTGYAPWSLTREAGVQSATVNGTIDIPQNIQPVLDTGFVDEKGNWKGVKSSDEEFFGFTKHIAIPNGETVLAPANANIDHLDMTGFNDLFFAINPSNGGAYAISAVMGPDTNSFANLSPINPASDLRGRFHTGKQFDNLFADTAETLAANVWNIYYFDFVFQNQKNMQFKIVNNSGGDSDIEVAFMRLV